MTEALQLSLAAAKRRESTISMIMVDIDHFTQINDSFGPEIGDQVIRKIAGILENISRACDVVARLDSEKFLLALPETELKAAKILAERIRLTIGEQPLLIDQQRIAVTASIGVTAARRGNIDLNHLSREAGHAVMLAKQGGRNQVASIDHNPIHLTSGQARG